MAIERTSFSARNLRGQIATEFFAYSGIFLLVVIITASSVFIVQDSEYAYYEHQYMKEVGYKFASAYNLAVSSGKGFTYSFEFQKTLFGAPYNISIVENNSIVIEWISPSHGEMIYLYPISHFTVESAGCIFETSTAQSGDKVLIIDSISGENKLTLYNDGSKITITRKCSP